MIRKIQVPSNTMISLAGIASGTALFLYPGKWWHKLLASIVAGGIGYNAGRLIDPPVDREVDM